MSKVEEMVKIELSNSCECGFCPACRIGYTGDSKCQECEADLEQSMDCFDCQSTDWLAETLASYFDRTSATTLRVETGGMNWNRVAGYTVIPANCEALIEALTFSGEWKLVFKIGEDTLTVTRYGHDEPTGSIFTVTKVELCVDCDGIVPVGTEVRDIEEVVRCYACANVCPSTGVQNCQAENCECERE